MIKIDYNLNLMKGLPALTVLDHMGASSELGWRGGAYVQLVRNCAWPSRFSLCLDLTVSYKFYVFSFTKLVFRSFIKVYKLQKYCYK